MVAEFFGGRKVPRFITHTNLVLLPKKKEVITFSNMRPISLSNFVNKIFSRVIHDRLVGILPELISFNQAVFVKGRSIVENILLAQEIVTDIRLRTKAGPNVVIKLDMQKAEYRLSWFFLTKVLGRWGSGSKAGGSAVSHFIYFGCGGDVQGSEFSAHPSSLQLIMEVLTEYEKASGQKVNKEKCAVYVHHLEDRQAEHVIYSDLIQKVLGRLQSWKGKLISHGGRAVLISHVLQSMPIHLLSAVDPPDYVIEKLHKIFAQFFWINSVGDRSRHWGKWLELCLPHDKGGLGFRSMFDVSKALFAKLWWNFRTKPSLWSAFMSNKYSKKINPVIV
ncbi:uncharacterized protein LOC124899193 [Capsicum annuum]|uniref:uncharacterized protein LOC124899193 n=1 Tax=Capsicum annuum TaxID=4072 RepID=UPI001FB1543C|nr:uncharacterized protein LOC124899193 [Capsicum annuum]